MNEHETRGLWRNSKEPVAFHATVSNY